MLQAITASHAIGLHCPALPLFGTEATRATERVMAQVLPPHTLMLRAGASVAALAKAVAPHAQTIWIACGPGNNGGDGLVAAALLHPWALARGAQVLVSWCGAESHLPADARFALSMARDAGVVFTDQPPEQCDLAIDALLGLGARTQAAPNDPEQTNQGQNQHLLQWLAHLHQCAPILLCVDMPTGLDADTGTNTIANKSINKSARATFCLTFITLKPGLFTADGQDQAGHVWLDDLGWHNMPDQATAQAPDPAAWLGIPAASSHHLPHEPALHNTHKGQFGDVWVLGGQGLRPSGSAMVGAAMLAATAALHAQAGRVFVVLLDPDAPSWAATQPELMLRSAQTIEGSGPLPNGSWVCGCGGGDAVAPFLPKLLNQAQSLVLDADALNALATSPALQTMLQARLALGFATVLTPHPLEAARLLGTNTADIQADRLSAARQLAAKFQCVCVLKGSGTVLASPSGLLSINPTGNARLSTAGTGDVLAGMVGAALAKPSCAWHQASLPTQASPMAWLDAVVLPAVAQAVFTHGSTADHWPLHTTLTAGALARQINPATSAPPAAK